MSAVQLRDELERAGVRMATVGGRLRVNAPRGALTPALREGLAGQRDALLALLAVEQAGRAKSEAPLEPRTAARRQRVLAFLDANPNVQRAVRTDASAEPGKVIVTIGLRGLGTGEVEIPAERYDAGALMELLDKYGAGAAAGDNQVSNGGLNDERATS